MNFPSGAFVRYKAIPWAGTYYDDIEVQVPSDDNNNTCGLCGTFGSTKKYDMTARDGKIFRITYNSVPPRNFTESWKYECLLDILF